jgi:polysaccharide pyruvyl transferase WcaK-like protein
MINLYSIRPKGFNIGNDVIYLGVNHFIRQAFKENYNVISLPATGKYESQRKAGISSQTVYEVNQFGHGVIVGGGNLYENGELEVNPTAIKALEKPLMIFSVSRGKIYNKKLELVDRTDVMTDDKMKILNMKADISLSRDKATFEYIENLGAKNNQLGGCPTLFINEIPQHLVPLQNTDKTDALISIRTPSLVSVPISYQYQIREDIIKMIETLRNYGYNNVKILCHDHRDMPFADSLGIDYVYTEDIYTFLSYLKNTRLNVTYRLHSFIPCLSLDIPTIKISYDQRAVSMLETLNVSEWNINMLKDNVPVEFENRLKNIKDLESIKKKASESTWQGLKETMINGCNTFAEMVKSNI